MKTMLLKHTKKGTLIRLYETHPEGTLFVRSHYDRSSRMYMLIKESEHHGAGLYPESAIRYRSGETAVEVA